MDTDRRTQSNEKRSPSFGSTFLLRSSETSGRLPQPTNANDDRSQAPFARPRSTSSLATGVDRTSSNIRPYRASRGPSDADAERRRTPGASRFAGSGPFSGFGKPFAESDGRPRRSADDNYRGRSRGPRGGPNRPHFGDRRGEADPSSTMSPTDRLRSLASEEPTEALMTLLSPRSGLLRFFSYEKMADSQLLELLVRVLSNACQSTFNPQSLGRLLRSVNESGFLRGPLLVHLTSRGADDLDAAFVRNVADVAVALLHHLPSSSVTNVTLLLSQLNGWARLNASRSTDAYGALKAVRDAEEAKSDVTKQIKSKELLRDQENAGQGDVDEEPPDDFRKIPAIPTAAEIKSDEPPFLRKNIVFGAYRDVDHYLDVQYRLLREDFVCPLREGLRTLQEYKDKNIPLGRLSDIRFYRGVQILTPYCTQKCVMYRARFDVTQFPRIRWESSKRLIFGSLVGLSNDNFETIVFGTVANRNPEDLRKGVVELCFEDTSSYQLDPNPYTVYQMVECSAYFEAYRHVLQGLQEIRPGSLPFEKYLLNQEKSRQDVDAPRYLRGRNANYDFAGLVEDYPYWRQIPVLDLKSWPSKKMLGLDDSQYAALQTAMTKEFVTIQGPPGTGKTFIGLKIVQLLLRNSEFWDGDQSPILVVCFTNHALDQFLEGILGICQMSPGQMIRVGGRSTSENKTLQACALFEIKKRGEARHSEAVQNAVRDVLEQMRQLQDEITVLVAHNEFARKHVLHEINLQQYMTETQSRTLYSRPYAFGNQSLLPQWLCFNEFSVGAGGVDDQRLEDGMTADDFILEDDEEEVSRLQQERQMDDGGVLTQRQQHLKIIKEATERCQEQLGLLEKDEMVPEHDQGWQKKGSKKNKSSSAVRRLISLNEAMSEEEATTVGDVWRLPLRDRWRLYNHWASCYCEEKSISVRNLCAKYNNCANQLTELNSEEDYQALKRARVVGMTTTGAAKYRQLLQRIHPKIIIVEEAAEVMEAHVVTTLSAQCQHLIMIGDHQQLRPNPTVYKLAKQYHLDISLFERMVKNDLHCDRLTIQHRMRPEIVKLIVPHVYKSLENHETVLKYDNIRGIRGNVFFISHAEVETTVEDTRSRSNKHEATFIAGLCRYLIQQGYKPTQITVLTMYTGQMFLLRQMMPRSAFDGVRITPVDNYQGEENDIILLSLVRSNQEGKIGFLQTQNRVCVALSRAKKGLYVIGNMELMADASHLWNGIVRQLRSAEQLVDALPLACQNHPENAVLVRTAADFASVPEGGCLLDCGFRLTCGHVCIRKCHPTDLDHAEYVCKKPCAKIVCENGHRCTRLCHAPCGSCQVVVEKTVPMCGHVQKMRCHVAPEAFVCKEPCPKLLPCGHDCQNSCGQPCTKECTVIIENREWPCLHQLTLECSRNPTNYDCDVVVQKKLICGHTVDAKCSDNIFSYKCTVKVTYSRCDDPAHEHVTECHRVDEERGKRCERNVNMTCSVDANHHYIAKCYDRQNTLCPIVCNAELTCGHRCVGTCSGCAESRRHKPCPKKCQKILRCQHQCMASCEESCPPCGSQCLTFCGHKLCSQPCGWVCDVCQLPCQWSCEHQRCQLRCHEPCTRPPCDAPCTRRLQCGHFNCVGLCGEPCPPWCGRCNAKNIDQMARFLKVENYSRRMTKFVHLQPCGHVVEVQHMDKWVETTAPKRPCEPQCVTCPICKKMVGFCPRYGSRIKTYMRDINTVKKASATTNRMSIHTDQALASFWPGDVDAMKAILFDDSEAGRRMSLNRLSLGAVCLWQECWNVLQILKRRQINGLPYVVETSAELESAKSDLIGSIYESNYDKVLSQVRKLHMTYLQLHAHRLMTFIKNPRLVRMLESMTYSRRNPSVSQISSINRELKMNFSPRQRDDIDDYLKYIDLFFQLPRMKTDLGVKKWLVCENGHAFGVAIDADAEQAECRSCILGNIDLDDDETRMLNGLQPGAGVVDVHIIDVMELMEPTLTSFRRPLHLKRTHLSHLDDILGRMGKLDLGLDLDSD